MALRSGVHRLQTNILSTEFYFFVFVTINTNLRKGKNMYLKYVKNYYLYANTENKKVNFCLTSVLEWYCNGGKKRNAIMHILPQKFYGNIVRR